MVCKYLKVAFTIKNTIKENRADQVFESEVFDILNFPAQAQGSLAGQATLSIMSFFLVFYQEKFIWIPISQASIIEVEFR